VQPPAERTENQCAARVVSRRGFLLLMGGTTGGALLAACGGATAPAQPTEAPKPAAPAAASTAGPAAAQTAPAAKPAAANLQGTALSIVQAANFVPDADPFYKKQIEDGFNKETGAQVTIEFVNNNDVQPKAAAAIQSGSGPDIFQLQHNWAYLYKDALVDVSDVVEEVRKATGDLYPMPEAYTKVDGRYLAVPHDMIGTVMHWRKSWFREAGVEQFPATIEAYHAAGKELKRRGHPLGQSLGHSTGDPVFWVYPLLWAYGGQEVDAAGKVAINSPGTLAAVAEMQRAWKEAYDETGLAWDDSGNNRAFLAETISATQNGASIWWVARKDQAPFFDDIGLDFLPPGPKGQFVMSVTNHYAIMKYSKNVEAAKAYIRWAMSDPVWMPWFELASSYHCGVGPKQNDNPIWDKFPPVARVFKKAPTISRPIGYPGPADQRAALVQSKYILVDMFAKAAQGDTPEAAVAWAEQEMMQIYT
jgi:multiple sugar transport system substrate-binding protein